MKKTVYLLALGLLTSLFWIISGCRKGLDSINTDTNTLKKEGLELVSVAPNGLSVNLAKTTYRTDVFPDGAKVPILRGLNWADEEDNFQQRRLLLSGIVDQDTYNKIYQKAVLVANLFKQNGANCVRIPINAATLGASLNSNPGNIDPSATYFKTKYKAIIDGLIQSGMYVIACYWPDGKGLAPYGSVDPNSLKNAWIRMVNTQSANNKKYIDEPQVYFEPINEPWNYAVSDLKDVYIKWIKDILGSNPSAALLHRVILAGADVEQNIPSIANESRFDNCLLGYHMYDFVRDMQNGGTNKTEPIIAYRRRTDWPNFFLNGGGGKAFKNQISEGIGKYVKRVVITEAGTTQNTSQMNFNDAGGYYYGYGGEKVPYMQGICNFVYTNNIGFIYWPGCKYDDGFAMWNWKPDGTGGNNPAPQNKSGLQWLQNAWKDNARNTWDPSSPNYVVNATYKITSVGTGKVLTKRTAWNGGEWPCIVTWNNANEQKWKIEDAGDGFFYLKNVSNNKYLDVSGNITIAGSAIGFWTLNGGTNQKWCIQQDCSGSGNIYIVGHQSWQCINVRGATTADYSDVCIYPFTNAENDTWKLELVQ